MTGFHQWLYVSDMRSTFAHDVTEPEFLEMRHGRGYGGELMLRLPEHARVSGWLAYTLSWSMRDFDGLVAPSDWDQRHILNLVTTVRSKNGYSVGGRVHYNTGRPYPVQTPPSTSGCRRSGRSICARTSGSSSIAARGTSTSSSETRRSTSR